MSQPLLIRAIAITGLALLSGVPTQAASGSAPGLLTFTFDDASVSQFTLGLPMAKEFGIKGTLFVVTGEADEATNAEAEALSNARANGDAVPDRPSSLVPDRWYMTWDEIRQFRDAGWEIGSHSITHPHLSEHEDARVADEISVSRDRIESEVGTPPVSFAPPYGDFDDRTLQMAMWSYHYNLLALGEKNGGLNPIGAIDPSSIDRLPVDIWTEPTSVCGKMVNAAITHSWLVLMFHGFTNGEPTDYETRSAGLRQIMQCARTLEDNGVIRVVTVAEAMDRVEHTAPSAGEKRNAEDGKSPGGENQ